MHDQRHASNAVGPQGAAPTIHVIGDATADWMLLAPMSSTTALDRSYQYEAESVVAIAAQPGSAALLHTVLTAGADAMNEGSAVPVSVSGITVTEEALHDPDDATFPRSYSAWRRFPVRVGAREMAWRVAEFLGRRPAARPSTMPAEPDGTLGCLAIDDPNLGFRDTPECWPACLRGEAPSPAHIILKMANPLARGRLWDALIAAHADRLTIYCSINDLRREYAPIGQPLSWERTSSDVAKAVRMRPDLARARRIVVAIGMSGAVLVERDGPATLVFDPAHQEGDWEAFHPGIPVGTGTCIAAALALEVARCPAEPDWLASVRRGLVAGRDAHVRGPSRRPDNDHRDVLHFPYAAYAQKLIHDDGAETFQSVSVPGEEEWTIFARSFGEGYRAVAARIAIEGDAEAVKGLPVERMGAWASVDRTEIESMRSVRNIIAEYLSQSHRPRPLSLAVFGPPGAGKSFAIKQMARAWAASGVHMTVLEFNLSQFRSLEALPAALQRVRDCAVEGALPLVFWDEFDTTFEGRPLGWLAQFLAPMQDGAFVEDGVPRPIGPAIFVFAGGTHPTMASFKTAAVEIPGAKATDFLSRLRGYVDVLGPNPMGDGDETYMLRRALLLRAMVGGRAPRMLAGGTLDIDPGVLRAFLDVGAYVHGARSMESIVEMSALTGKARYERSALPARHQLGLHVDAEEFLRLVAVETAHPSVGNAVQ